MNIQIMTIIKHFTFFEKKTSKTKEYLQQFLIDSEKVVEII